MTNTNDIFLKLIAKYQDKNYVYYHISKIRKKYEYFRWNCYDHDITSAYHISEVEFIIFKTFTVQLYELGKKYTRYSSHN